jgi:hypothetical protein
MFLKMAEDCFYSVASQDEVTEQCRILHNTERCDLCRSANIVTTLTCRRMR